MRSELSRRAISPVIAIVILLLMTVAAGGMAYLTITTYQETAQTRTVGGVQQLGQQAGTILKVESVKEGTVYVRNIGTETVGDVKVYADGQEVGACDEVDEGGYCIIQVTETIDCGDDNRCTLTIGATTTPIVTGEVSVEEEELELPPGCGNGVCTFDEDPNNCWTDCGGSLSLLKNITFQSYNNETHPETAWISNIDSDDEEEIIWGGEYSQYDIYDLRIYNYSSSDINLETNYTWDYPHSTYNYIFDIHTADIDSDSYVELIVAGGTVATFNKTQTPELPREANLTTNPAEDWFSAVRGVNIDDDSEYELVIARGLHSTNATLEIYEVQSDGSLVFQVNTTWLVPYLTNTWMPNLRTGDIDHDGRAEVVVLTRNATSPSIPNYPELRILNVTETEITTEANITLTHGDNRIHESIELIDIDNDGRTELLSGGIRVEGANYISELRVYNYTQGQFNLERTDDISVLSPGDMTVTDIDSDGKKEIIIASYDQVSTELNVTIIEHNNTALVLQDTIYAWTGMAKIPRARYGDVDNDGKNELVLVGNDDAYYGKINIYEVS